MLLICNVRAVLREAVLVRFVGVVVTVVQPTG
jgi:hypothetical protein